MTLLSKGGIIASVLTFGLPVCGSARADWPTDPTANVAVCTAPYIQVRATVVGDGAQGAIIAWRDARSDGVTTKVYLQHVLASGLVDPAWPANGAPASGSAGAQDVPQLVPDGHGGAMVVWLDYRSGASGDVYATHVRANGTLDPTWPLGGVAICTAAGTQTSEFVVPDGAGGAYVSWLDLRADTTIYAHHLLATGALDPLWPVDGASLGAVANNHQLFAMTSDGGTGAYVAWPDYRSGSFDIFVQHLIRGGVDPTWPLGGRQVCAAPGDQTRPAVACDPAGGVFVAWQDLRSGTNNVIYSQHLSMGGGLDPSYPSSGLAVSALGGDQLAPRVVSDLSGGYLVGWQDYGTGANPDLYAQHVTGSGAIDGNWPAAGFGFCLASGSQQNLLMTSDGFGGALAIWDDWRSGSANSDIYATHIPLSGTADMSWPIGGQAVSSAFRAQTNPAAINDGSGGIIAAWADTRNSGSLSDIYAQRVQANGQLGGTVVGVDDGAPGLVWGIRRVWPSPARSRDLSVEYAVGRPGPASLELVDLQGRLVLADGGETPAGVRVWRPQLARELASGVYFVRMRAGNAVSSARIVVLK